MVGAMADARRARRRNASGCGARLGPARALLRSSDDPVEDQQLKSAWHDVAQRQRALASLVQDGLVVPVGSGWSLPG